MDPVSRRYFASVAKILGSVSAALFGLSLCPTLIMEHLWQGLTVRKMIGDPSLDSPTCNSCQQSSSKGGLPAITIFGRNDFVVTVAACCCEMAFLFWVFDVRFS